MREILSIHVGHAGVQIGLATWEKYCSEFGIKHDRSAEPNVSEQDGFSSLFTQTPDGMCIPNAVMIDTDPHTTNGEWKNFAETFIQRDRILTSKEDADGLFSKGYFMGYTKLERLENFVRSQLEMFDSCRGIVLYRGAGGGTGSGTTSSLFEQLDGVLGKHAMIEFAVYPSRESGVIEPYNTLLGLNTVVMDEVKCSIGVDNQALNGMAWNALKFPEAKYSDTNKMLAEAIASVTANFRLDRCLRDLQSQIVVSPVTHFPFVSYAPLRSGNITYHYDHKPSISLLTRCSFGKENRMLTVDNDPLKYFACSVMYRGKVSQESVNSALSGVKQRSTTTLFMNWSPCDFYVHINGKESKWYTKEPSVTMIGNCSNLSQNWALMNDHFDKLYKKRAFVHYFTQSGIELSDFEQARENGGLIQDSYESLDHI